jgi:hypothetical protein
VLGAVRMGTISRPDVLFTDELATRLQASSVTADLAAPTDSSFPSCDPSSSPRPGAASRGAALPLLLALRTCITTKPAVAELRS